MQDLGFGLDNLQVYVCPEGYAEATGTWVANGIGIDVLARIKLDISGPAAKLRIEALEAGNLSIASQILSWFDDDIESIDFDVNITDIAYLDDRVELTGAP